MNEKDVDDIRKIMGYLEDSNKKLDVLLRKAIVSANKPPVKQPPRKKK